MSKTTMALLVKLAITFVASWIVFGLIDGNTLGTVFLISIVGAIVNYLIGDLLVLPNFGNIVASLGDGVMGALAAYVMSFIVAGFQTNLTSLFIFAAIIAVAEYVFHMYLLKSEEVAP